MNFHYITKKEGIIFIPAMFSQILKAVPCLLNICSFWHIHYFNEKLLNSFVIIRAIFNHITTLCRYAFFLRTLKDTGNGPRMTQEFVFVIYSLLFPMSFVSVGTTLRKTSMKNKNFHSKLHVIIYIYMIAQRKATLLITIIFSLNLSLTRK